MSLREEWFKPSIYSGVGISYAINHINLGGRHKKHMPRSCTFNIINLNKSRIYLPSVALPNCLATNQESCRTSFALCVEYGWLRDWQYDDSLLCSHTHKSLLG